MKSFLVSFLFLGLFLLSSPAQILVDNFDDFKDACEAAQPGDEIILKAGRYTSRSMTLSNVQGTAENPVIIRAETIGADTLDAGTYIDLRHCSYVTIQGFVINITEKSTTFKVQASNNIRITQNILDGSGEDYYKDDGTSRNSSVWISIQGIWDSETAMSHDNRIDHNLFRNKHTLGNMIRIDGTNQLYVSQNDIIEYNHFKNMGPRAENEMEAIRIGWSAMSESDGFSQVRHNLFEECNGDPEIISVKCNKNTLKHNTFLRCQGTLSLRHGNESVVEGNYFLGEEAEGTGGVRIYGSDHRIINNHFEGLTGTRWDAPITMTYGDADEGDGSLSKHFRIERAIIANNTLKGNHHGIEVGYDNNDKYNKPPRDVVLANNLVDADTGTLVTYINQPENMSWVNNLLYAYDDATLYQGLTLEDQITDQDPVLEFVDSLGVFRASSATPSYTASSELTGTISLDIDGQLRLTLTQYGADEKQDGSIYFPPLTSVDVGPDLGDYLQLSAQSFTVPVSGDTLNLSISSNLDWQISGQPEWLSLSHSSGNGDARVAIMLDRNESGVSRTATLVIESSNAAEEQITKHIIILQLEKDPPYLELSGEELDFDAEEGSQTIEIRTNVDWTAASSASWVSINPSQGNGDSDLIVTVEENLSRMDRSASLSILAAGLPEQLIMLTQEGSVGTELKLNIIDAIATTEETSKGNIADNVYDGDLENRWSGEGDGAHITLELKSESRVSFIKVGLYKGSERQSYFDVLSSVDGLSFFDALMDVTTEITDEALVIYDFPDTTARYIRIIGHGNSSSAWNSYTEFEVWGWEGSTFVPSTRADQALLVYPNPSTGSFTIRSKERSEILITDTAGRILRQYKLNADETRIETDLAPGAYLLISKSAGSIDYQTIIIQ